MTRERSLTLPARDGFPLAATAFEPDSPGDGPIVIVHSATAVPRKIYAGFAGALAEQGARVVTYDYRGVGGSRPVSLKGFAARMRDWAAFDAPGVIDWALAHWPGRPLLGVGHSFGGHAFGLMPGNDRHAKVATVASQSGHWRFLAPHEQWRVYALMKVLAPAAVALSGYMPGRRLGLGEDLPTGVLVEWRRWCLMPDYFYSDPTLDLLANFKALTAPVLAVGLSDDPWATPHAIDHMVAGFVSAKVTRLTLTPAEAGVARVGHLGFFRPEHRTTLWPKVTDWLLA